MRRSRVVGAFLLLSSLAACGRSARPPIIVLSIDTLRHDSLRAFDPEAQALPRLDAFAAESVRFRNAISTAPWTLPAHASLFTGLYPQRHGATDRRVRIDAGVPTLAETLRQLGYETTAVTGGGFVRAEFGFDRGFDHFWSSPVADRNYDQSEELFDHVIAAIEGRAPDAPPLFVFGHTFAVHDYFFLHPWAVETLADKTLLSAYDYSRCLDGSRACSVQEWKTLRALYDAELAHLDRHFGRLLDAIDANEAFEDAVVVLLSDHGEGFDPARNRIHHGGRLHEDQLRVPLLVRAPGAAPRDVDAPVSLVDVMPSLLELAGATLPPGLDGVSFVAALRGQTLGADRALLAQESNSTWWGSMRIMAPEIHSTPLAVGVVRGDRWYLRTKDREELYDVAADRRQEHDLVATAPDAAALRARAVEAGSVARTQTQPLQSDEALDAQLRALGYAE